MEMVCLRTFQLSLPNHTPYWEVPGLFKRFQQLDGRGQRFQPHSHQESFGAFGRVWRDHSQIRHRSFRLFPTWQGRKEAKKVSPKPKKAVEKKSPAKKSPAKKSPVKKSPAKAKKTVAKPKKVTDAKKSPAKEVAAKKTAVKKTATKKPASKKTVSKKVARRKQASRLLMRCLLFLADRSSVVFCKTVARPFTAQLPGLNTSVLLGQVPFTQPTLQKKSLDFRHKLTNCS